MGKYTGVTCPVCGVKFDDKADVVVCHICGTPHHRECYKKNNDCVNAQKHDAGFVFEPPIIIDNKEVNLQDLRELVEQKRKAATNEATIEGVAVKDIEQFVGSASSYYIPRFKLLEGKKFGMSFNFGAATFALFSMPFIYFFYRKMFLKGAIFLALTLINMILLVLLISHNIELNYQTLEFNTLFESISSMQISDTYSGVLYYTFYLIHLGSMLVSGLFANNLYKNHVINKIEGIKTRTLDQKERQIAYIVLGRTSILVTILSIIFAYISSSFIISSMLII